jgi:hypothetical protein
VRGCDIEFYRAREIFELMLNPSDLRLDPFHHLTYTTDEKVLVVEKLAVDGRTGSSVPSCRTLASARRGRDRSANQMPAETGKSGSLDRSAHESVGWLKM